MKTENSRAVFGEPAALKLMKERGDLLSNPTEHNQWLERIQRLILDDNQAELERVMGDYGNALLVDMI